MSQSRTVLLACLTKLAQLQRERVDKVALQEAIDALPESADAFAQIKSVAHRLQASSPKFLSRPDATKMPCLLFSDQGEWQVVRGQNGQGFWVVESYDVESSRWQEHSQDQLVGNCLAQVSTAPPFVASRSPVYRLIRNEVFSHKRLLGEALLGSVTINIVALASAFYTMQECDS